MFFYSFCFSQHCQIDWGIFPKPSFQNHLSKTAQTDQLSVSACRPIKMCLVNSIWMDWPQRSANPDWGTDGWMCKHRWFCGHFLSRHDCWNIQCFRSIKFYMTRHHWSDSKPALRYQSCFQGEAAPITQSVSACVPISPKLFNPCQHKEPKSDTRVLGLFSQLFGI